jgi:hypothetical protein
MAATGPARAPSWASRLGALWRYSVATGVSAFGAGSAFFASSRNDGVEPIVPSAIVGVTAITRTPSGKKMALPVKKLLPGASADSALRRDATTNACCIAGF